MVLRRRAARGRLAAAIDGEAQQRRTAEVEMGRDLGGEARRQGRLLRGGIESPQILDAQRRRGLRLHQLQRLAEALEVEGAA